VILGFNLIVPALVAWGLTNTPAKLGSAFALFLIALIGYYFCITKPLPMLFIIRGGVLVALSQFVPALQLVAGAISIRSLILFRIVPESSFGFPAKLLVVSSDSRGSCATLQSLK